MKVLKTVLYIILALIVVWLTAAAFVSGDCKYEKSVVIDAPADEVWQNTNSLKAMEKWSPWNDKDPHMKKEWKGTTGQPGEEHCWEGNDEVGKGCLKVLKVDAAGKRIDVLMKFLTPYESEAREYVTVVPEGNGSRATWGFTSQIPYPFTLTKFFMDLEDAIGADFQLGLERLKAVSEKP
ncbi:MAG: SRPBCC family protein [Weeksellaceae bacterium]|nr:SRPBCC family protein [Weeksellaceae bacterium]